MASTATLSYKRLKHETNWFDDHEEVDDDSRRRSNNKFHHHINIRFRRKLRVRLRVRVPSLRKFLRRKARLLLPPLPVRFAWKKVYGRLNESRSHFGDLFAGNYVFMQVTPTPLKTVRSSYQWS
ncbi:hypothetical protein OROMI_032378 [Orobanche minor]